MEKEVRANNGKSLLLPYPKMFRKEAVFRNVLEKAVRKKKTKVFFKHAPRNNEMKGFIL